MTTTIYAVVTAAWPTGDVAGSLVLDTGEALWSHMSSNYSWLRRDLTNSFSDRRVHLETRYPDGYDVLVVDERGYGDLLELPDDVRERNIAWHEAAEAKLPPCNGHCELEADPGFADADCPRHGHKS